MSLSPPPPPLAAVHALETACFAPHAWSRAQVAGTLDQDGVVCVLEAAVGFALGARVLDEVELYRIGVRPEARRHGHGRRLLAAFMAAAHTSGARRVFLEVREDNTPARALYSAAGLTLLGRRPGYYPDGCAALVLGGPLAAGPHPGAPAPATDPRPTGSL